MASQFYDRRNDGDDHFADGFAGFVEFRELPRRYRHTVDRALGDVEDGRQILDGAIEFEMKSTGIIFTSAYQGEGYPYATEVAPGLAAPAHQHLFSARQDMEVDGNVNAVDEIDVARCAVGPDNKHGIGVHQEITRLKTEGGRLADNNRGRVWQTEPSTSDATVLPRC